MAGSGRQREDSLQGDRRDLQGARVAHPVGARHSHQSQRGHPAAHLPDVLGKSFICIER